MGINCTFPKFLTILLLLPFPMNKIRFLGDLIPAVTAIFYESTSRKSIVLKENAENAIWRKVIILAHTWCLIVKWLFVDSEKR